MSDVHIIIPTSKSHSAIVDEIYVIMSLAQVGERVAYPESDIQLDNLGKLFKVIRERLGILAETLES